MQADIYCLIHSCSVKNMDVEKENTNIFVYVRTYVMRMCSQEVLREQQLICQQKRRQNRSLFYVLVPT